MLRTEIEMISGDTKFKNMGTKMNRRTMKVTYLASAVSLAMMQLSSANAQEVAQAAPLTTAAAGSNSLNLDQVIVTGTPVGVSKMRSSVSISTLDPDQLQMSAPTSSADALRSIPGIHAEASAGEGNTNVTVRGIPISAGGSRYVGFQEDGLPVLENGDYAFVTPDMFVKLDNSLDHIEAVRGGAASVLGSNSPGGIINFISKTGVEEGGSIGLTKGLGFDENRLDFDYGVHLSPQTRMFIGGFYREGDGTRSGSVPIETGGQIKANITHDFSDGSFIRLSIKHLDDQTPLNMPVPFTLSNANPTKANPATISAAPGFDPRTASYYSPYWSSIVGLTNSGATSYANINSGLTVKENALGLQGSFKLGNGWTLDESFRQSQKSGGFESGYPTGPTFNAFAGTTYASGPNKGQPYTGNVLEVAAFNASFDNLNSTVNAIKVSKTFDLPNSGKLTTLVGWDIDNQQIGVTQNLPHYLMSATGNQPVLLNGLNNNGLQTNTSGLLPQSTWWGNQTRDIQYDMSSPYVDLSYEAGPLNLDAGLRRDMQKVTGAQTSSVSAGTYTPGVFPALADTPVNYSKDNNSYSLGGNYKLTNNLAVFARYSDGASFNVVERMGGPFDGTQPITINTVKQTELGVKWRDAGFSAFVTLFKADTAEGNYDLTTHLLTQNTYNAKGVEVESAYRMGGFNISGSFTYTDASIVGALDPTIVGNQPQRLAKYIYQVVPSYQVGDFVIGGSLIGTDKSFGDNANTIILPSYYTVNVFGNYQISPRATVTLSANNLFNKIGWTEYDNGQGARSINGRTAKIAFKYAF